MRIPGDVRKMTLGERQRAGIGAVGPKHPRMRQFIRQMGLTAAKEPEPESEDEPAMSDAAEEEEEAPNLRPSESCGNCTHFDSEEMRCNKHDCGCEPTDTCDDFEEGISDEEQGAEMTGEY
jgi:hypothetical protein